MFTSVLTVLLFLTFSVLGGFHFYWFLGGKWGVEQVIPTKAEGPNSLEIPRVATLFVAFVLTSLAFCTW